MSVCLFVWWVGINPIDSRKIKSNGELEEIILLTHVCGQQQRNEYSNSSNQIRSNSAAATTYSNRSIHALDIAFVYQYFARTQAQCLNFAFVQILTPSQSFDLRIQ